MIPLNTANKDVSCILEFFKKVKIAQLEKSIQKQTQNMV